MGIQKHHAVFDSPSGTAPHPLPKEQYQTAATESMQTVGDSVWITKVPLAQRAY